MATEKLTLYTQCKDDNGQIGTFLRDEKGIQRTKTYSSVFDLFKSKEYNQYRKENPNHLIELIK